MQQHSATAGTKNNASEDYVPDKPQAAGRRHKGDRAAASAPEYRLFDILRAPLHHPVRRQSMEEAFKQLSFSSFEVRNLGLIRILIVLTVAVLATYHATRSGNPHPLFGFLALAFACFVTSLFPERNVRVSFRNVNLVFYVATGLALLQTLSPYFYLGDDPKYQTSCVTFLFVALTYAIVHAAVVAGIIHVAHAPTALSAMRWAYALITLSISAIVLIWKQLPWQLSSLPAAARPIAQYLLTGMERLLVVEQYLLMAVVALAAIEGVYRAVVNSPHFLRFRSFDSLPYPDEQYPFVVGLVIDARVNALNLGRFLMTQAWNLLVILHALLTTIREIVQNFATALLRYGATAIAASIAIALELLPLLASLVVLILLAFGAREIVQANGEWFVARLFAVVLLCPCVLLVAHLANFPFEFRRIVVHFRHSFIGFWHFAAGLALFVGGALWALGANQFAPGPFLKFSLGYGVVLLIVIFAARSLGDGLKTQPPASQAQPTYAGYAMVAALGGSIFAVPAVRDGLAWPPFGLTQGGRAANAAGSPDPLQASSSGKAPADVRPAAAAPATSAVAALQRKAQEGQIEARVELARRYFQGEDLPKDYSQALHWYTMAAGQGHVSSQMAVANMHVQGLGTEKSDARAVEWYRKAAAAGYAPAQNAMGLFNAAGRGGEQRDPAQAAEWYRRSAAQNYAWAQLNLGRMLEAGKDVPRDTAEAIKLYLKAVGRTGGAAEYELALSHAAGSGVPRSEQDAVDWLRKAAAQGYAQAQHAMAARYESGRGVEKNLGAAVDWYRKAALQGHSQAQVELARKYDKGLGTERATGLALEWYRKAAAQGHTTAQYELGRRYELGVDVPRDLTQAIEWYRKAAKGNYSARLALKRLGVAS